MQRQTNKHTAVASENSSPRVGVWGHWERAAMAVRERGGTATCVATPQRSTHPKTIAIAASPGDGHREQIMDGPATCFKLCFAFFQDVGLHRLNSEAAQIAGRTRARRSARPRCSSNRAETTYYADGDAVPVRCGAGGGFARRCGWRRVQSSGAKPRSMLSSRTQGFGTLRPVRIDNEKSFWPRRHQRLHRCHQTLAPNQRHSRLRGLRSTVRHTN